MALQFLGSLDEAQDVYSRLLPEYSQNIELMANLVALAAARKDYVSLREYSDRLLRGDSKSRIALEGLFTAAFSQQDLPKAISSLTQIAELAPEDFHCWYNLGVANQKAGMAEQAIRCYREALRIDPKAAQAHANLGTALQDRGDYAAAKASYEEALTLSPAPGPLWNLALVCEQLGEPEAAELAYEQLVEISREWADAWFRLATIRFEREEFEGALQAFESAVSRKANWPEGLINIGVCRYNLTRFDGARQAFEEALAVNPGNLYALTGAVAAAVAIGDAARALEHYQEIQVVGDSLPELAFNVGLTLQQSGQDAAAIGCYRDAIEKRSDFPEALVNLGHALEATGESDQAEEHWARAMEIAPELAATHFA